jgi:hypothetical protein
MAYWLAYRTIILQVGVGKRLMAGKNFNIFFNFPNFFYRWRYFAGFWCFEAILVLLCGEECGV